MSSTNDKMPDISTHWKLAEFVPKLQAANDWLTWDYMFLLGITAIDPRFKEIIDGTLTDPVTYRDEYSTVGFIPADGSRTPYDTPEGGSATPHATLDKSRAFAQLNAMGSVLLRQTLGLAPALEISGMRDLKASYHALWRMYGIDTGPCNYENCNDIHSWMQLKFQNYDDPCDFLRQWERAMDCLLESDHKLGHKTIFDVFTKAICDHDGAKDFLHSLPYGCTSMDTVYQKFVQFVPFSDI